MKRKIWEHARIATMREGNPYGLIEDGAIVTDGRLITWVGPTDDLPADLRDTAEQRHDCTRRCITTGLIDAHTHLIYAGHRALEFEMRVTGTDYREIARRGGGILSTVRATREASDETLRASAERRLHALLREGVTTVEIKSGYGLDRETELRMLRLARELGRRNAVTVRATYLGLHAVPPEYADLGAGVGADAYVDFVITEMLPLIAAENLADAVDAYCESIAFSPAQIERYFTAASELGLRVKMHADQLAPTGATALAARFGALSADHMEYARRSELEAFARAGSAAVLLPGAYYFLREKTPPPIRIMRELGIPMALATDCNPGTSPITSLLLIMNMGCTLFGLSPEEALAGVTRNAALALGMENEAGTLQAGKRADFVVWDIDHPRELAYTIGPAPCAQIIQNGRLVKDTPT